MTSRGKTHYAWLAQSEVTIRPRPKDERGTWKDDPPLRVQV
jgi:hypothetical protein